MENAFNFTSNRLNKLKNRSGKDENYKDLNVKELRLRLSSVNKKTFRLRAWDKKRGRTVQMVLGTFPAMTIDGARRKAVELLNDLSQGVDIVAERNAVKGELTFDELFNHWLKTRAKIEKKTWQDDVSRYDSCVKSYLGKKRISEITPEMIIKWRIKLQKQPKKRANGTLTNASINRAYALVKTVFNQSAPHLSNPCAEVKEFEEISRDVFLKQEELSRFFVAAEDVCTTQRVHDFVLLSLFTGARRGNVLSMEWKELHLEHGLWLIPGEKFKNKTPMTVTLVQEAIDILKKRKERITSNYVFPAETKTGHYMNPAKGWKSLLERADLDSSFRLHDLRRTLGSFQAITGSSTKIIGATLGHKTEKATAVYARLINKPVKESMERAVAEMRG